MIRSLKRKFIVCAMAAVTALLLVILIALNGANFIMLRRQTDTLLDIVGDGGGIMPMIPPPSAQRPFMPPVDADTMLSMRYFSVHFNEAGEIIGINTDRISAVDTEAASVLAEKVIASGRESGFTGAYRYKVRQLYDTGLRTVIFTDFSDEWSSFFTVLALSGLIFVVSWLAMLLLVVLLSRRAIQPVIDNMEKQKQFITNAGHDLKTPLTIILANAEALELYNGQSKWSSNIRLQAERLTGLTQNLLTLAKLDEEVELPREPIDVTAAVSEALAGFEDAAARRQLTLTSSLEPGLVICQNRDNFAKLLSILLDNAVRYANHGGSLELTLARTERGIRLRISNTTDHLPDAAPEQLFERFWRADASRGSGGFGIGLSAARAICESMGGSLAAAYEGERVVFTARI